MTEARALVPVVARRSTRRGAALAFLAMVVLGGGPADAQEGDEARTLEVRVTVWDAESDRRRAIEGAQVEIAYEHRAQRVLELARDLTDPEGELRTPVRVPAGKDGEVVVRVWAPGFIVDVKTQPDFEETLFYLF